MKNRINTEVSSTIGGALLKVIFEVGTVRRKCTLGGQPNAQFLVTWDTKLKSLGVEVGDTAQAVLNHLPPKRTLEHWPHQYLESMGGVDISGDGSRWTIANVENARKVFRVIFGLVRPRAPHRNARAMVSKRRHAAPPPAAHSYRIDWRKGRSRFSHPKGRKTKVVTIGPRV